MKRRSTFLLALGMTATLLLSPAAQAGGTGFTTSEIAQNESAFTDSEESQSGQSLYLQAPTETFKLEDPVDADKLLAGYLRSAMYGNEAASPLANYGETQLTSELDHKLYAILKEDVAQVAAGECTSTIFTVNLTELGVTETLSFTAEDLGVDAILVQTGTGVAWADGAYTALQRAMGYSGFSKIVSLLRVDSPYEFYWTDMTQANRTMGSFVTASFSTADLNTIYVEPDQNLTFKFAVSQDYAPAGASDAYTTDPARTGAASKVVATAQKIVAEQAALADFDKLTAYKDIICEMVDYDFDSAENEDTPYGDPWQLINVFDGDPQTKVVCEGYSKAFQYLCDLTDFEQDIVSYLVSGTMNNGPHMWNIVSTPTGNYHVDVTNSDAGMIGEKGDIFMALEPTIPGESYDQPFTFLMTGMSIAPVTYCYDAQTVQLYGESILTLGEKEFVTPSPTAAPEPSAEPTPGPIESDTYPIEDGMLVLDSPANVAALLAGMTGTDIRINSPDGTLLAPDDQVGTGATLAQGDSEAELTVVLYGDLDGSGGINTSDLLQLRRALLGLINLEGAQLKAATIVTAGEVPETADLLQLRRVLLGIADSMRPVG